MTVSFKSSRLSSPVKEVSDIFTLAGRGIVNGSFIIDTGLTAHTLSLDRLRPKPVTPLLAVAKAGGRPRTSATGHRERSGVSEIFTPGSTKASVDEPRHASLELDSDSSPRHSLVGQPRGVGLGRATSACCMPPPSSGAFELGSVNPSAARDLGNCPEQSEFFTHAASESARAHLNYLFCNRKYVMAPILLER